MKRILALLSVLVFFVGPIAFTSTPALAVGIAQIAGTGTNGALVSSTFNAGASMNLTTTASVPSGSLIIAIGAGNATGVTQDFSCSDGVNGTYTAGQGVTALTAASVKIMYVYTVGTLSNGSTITCTVSGGNGFSVTILAFSGSSSTPYDSASTNATGTGTGTLTVGPTGTLNGPCGSANCEVLILAGMTRNQDGNVTMASGFTNVGVSLTSSPYIFGYKIVSATTAVSASPSTTSTSGNWAEQLEGFMAAASGSAHGPCVLGSGILGC